MTIIELIILFLILWLFFHYHFPIIITFKKLDKLAKCPTRAYAKDACWDVYSLEDFSVPPGQWREFKTGIAYAPWPHIYIPFFNLTLTPFGNVAYKVHTRSGMATKKGARNHLGIMDNGYRGEMTIWIFNHKKDYPIRVHVGDKIAQLEFYKVPTVKMIEVKKLSNSNRNVSGFGSSGK